METEVIQPPKKRRGPKRKQMVGDGMYVSVWVPVSKKDELKKVVAELKQRWKAEGF